jgi:AcrR family transcriptional regulator
MSRPSRCQDDRRVPQQERGRATRDALLDATAELLDEVGYEATTTKEIAARAGTSIGAFYQFFANKDAAVNELVRGYRERIHAFLAQQTSIVPSGGLSVAWTRDMIAGLGDIYRNLKGFRGVWGGRFSNGPLDRQARALRQEVFAALDEGLADAFPNVDVDSRQRCLTMTLDTATLLLGHAVHPEVVHGELHRMLGLYLASYFSPAGSGRRRRAS